MKWINIPGFGVAGNFTGHLEQAGESPDFVAVQTLEPQAPKGVFPFYIPSDSTHPLSVSPYSHSEIRLLNEHENHQIEPEVSILFDVEYQGSQVLRLHPKTAYAHNDCSIRRKGANKISEKKNWGPLSKGIAPVGISLNGLNHGDILDHYHLGCWLIRDGVLHPYGVTSAVKDYSYFHERLLHWLVDKLNNQQDHGPLEDLHQHLKECNHPSQVCISIGATRYTPFGEEHFLQTDDTPCVALYDTRHHTEQSIASHLLTSEDSLKHASILKQQILPPKEPLC